MSYLRRRYRRYLAALGVAGLIAWWLFGRGSRATTEASPASLAQTKRPAVPSAVSKRPAIPTPEERPAGAAQNAEGDYVGQMVPMLRGWPKQAQLQALKQMVLMPGDKLAFATTVASSSPRMRVEERGARSSELAEALIESLEAEGIHYDLPSGFKPVGVAIPPPDPASYPAPESHGE